LNTLKKIFFLKLKQDILKAPALEIYYPLKTSIFSVTLRITGVFLTLGVGFIFFDLFSFNFLEYYISFNYCVFLVLLVFFFVHQQYSFNHISFFSKSILLFKYYKNIIFLSYFTVIKLFSLIKVNLIYSILFLKKHKYTIILTFNKLAIICLFIYLLIFNINYFEVL